MSKLLDNICEIRDILEFKQRNEDIDWENTYEVWEYLKQQTVERVSNETDEHYKERLLKYMEDNQ